ncbi:MAG: hypothetical protein ACP5OC_04575 [Thermoplasmata archaeon]
MLTSSEQSAPSIPVVIWNYLFIQGVLAPNLDPTSVQIVTDSSVPQKLENISCCYTGPLVGKIGYGPSFLAPMDIYCHFVYEHVKNDTAGNVTQKTEAQYRVSYADHGSSICTYTLTNQTGTNANASYRFSFLVGYQYEIGSIVVPTPYFTSGEPFMVNIQVSLMGLSKPVTLQISLNLEDAPT